MRREGRDFPVVDILTRQLSPQPVAIGAVVEVTKRLKPLMLRVNLMTRRSVNAGVKLHQQAGVIMDHGLAFVRRKMVLIMRSRLGGCFDTLRLRRRGRAWPFLVV